MKASITVNGCDDSTYVDLEVTEEELAVLNRLADIVNEQASGCMPTMEVET